MKKFLVIVLLVVASQLCYSFESAGEPDFYNQRSVVYTHIMTGRVAQDGVESLRFSYDDKNLLIEVYDSSEVIVRDSLRYDANSNVTKIDTYQLISGQWKYVCYVEYTYDEKSNRTTRSNYNSFGGSTFTQGGIYYYSYNDDNTMSGYSGYIAGTTPRLFESSEFVYENGKLYMEIQKDGSNVETYKFVHSYDELTGNVDTIAKYQNTGSSWDLESMNTFVYDSLGNCLEDNSSDALGNYTNRRLYEYDYEVSTQNVVMPYDNPEGFLPIKYNNVNKCVLEKWYTLDADFILQYVGDFDYEYRIIETEDNSVCEIPNQNTLDIYPNPVSSCLTVSYPGDFFASIYDLNGRHVMDFANRNVDLSALESGVYLLKIKTDSFVKVDRIVKTNP